MLSAAPRIAATPRCDAWRGACRRRIATGQLVRTSFAQMHPCGMLGHMCQEQPSQFLTVASKRSPPAQCDPTGTGTSYICISLCVSPVFRSGGDPGVATETTTTRANRQIQIGGVLINLSRETQLPKQTWTASRLSLGEQREEQAEEEEEGVIRVGRQWQLCTWPGGRKLERLTVIPQIARRGQMV